MSPEERVAELEALVAQQQELLAALLAALETVFAGRPPSPTFA